MSAWAGCNASHNGWCVIIFSESRALKYSVFLPWSLRLVLRKERKKVVRKERFDAGSLLKTFFKGAFPSLNFIRLLRVVITPLVTVVERRKRLEAIGLISSYPFPTLTQRGRLFLFLKSRFCKWRALIRQHFCQAFLPKIKISCVRFGVVPHHMAAQFAC